MDSRVFLGGSIIAAVVAGTIALLAPCGFSVMLPAYFASSVQNRRALVGMTFVFAAGVATVILPLALGAVALRRLLIGGHTYLYVGGGGRGQQGLEAGFRAAPEFIAAVGRLAVGHGCPAMAALPTSPGSGPVG